ncbi:MAG: hypothetical protein WBM02_06840 [bacterium]
MKSRSIIVFQVILISIIVLLGCDLFENDGDWDNLVTIEVVNESTCLVSLFLDGRSQTSMEPGAEFTKTDVGKGKHLLEAYPWNDAQFACDHIVTDDLKAGQSFLWRIPNDGDCGDCPPTPVPTETPTPTETPEP